MHNRLAHIQSELSNRGLDGMLVEDSTMFYYLTGLKVSAGICLVTLDKALVIVDSRYLETAKRESPFPAHLREGNTLKELLSSLKLAAVGFDSNHSTYAQFEAWKEANGGAPLQGIAGLFHEMRQIKDEKELQLLREAAALGSKGYDYGVELLREGITEAEVAREIELFWKKEGAEGTGFDPIIAFGRNSSMPHYRAGDVTLKKGMPVLIDIGVTLNQYQSDMCRVVFFGDPDPRMLEIYPVVLEAQEAALQLCRPGVTTESLDAAAREVIEKAGFGDFFTHSLGHGVGLDVHEQPYLRTKKDKKETVIQEGMVFTIEPGIYLPDIGGIRIEDCVAITHDGYENLTNRPKELTFITLE